MKKISIIFGTRPEAIKLCPLVLALMRHPDFEAHVCVTSQHREMLDQMLQVFGVTPDVDLAIMQPNQSLSSLTARVLSAIDRYLRDYAPDIIIVQGDTTTTFCASLSGFYNKIRVGHVEAGLRTKDKFSPFPEEINRILTSHIADYHFAPTKASKKNLLAEGILESRITITGNTVIDALLYAVKEVERQCIEIPGLPSGVVNEKSTDSHIVLITGHRRESFGKGFRSLCMAVSQLAQRFPEMQFVYPVHLNPNVQVPVFEILSGIRNVHLINPLSYLPFVKLMLHSKLILTDSGGVQEEAPGLGIPVLVTRDITERPEAVEAGSVRLVGTDKQKIIDAVSLLLTNEEEYSSMARAVNPYGDGKACSRIISVLRLL